MPWRYVSLSPQAFGTRLCAKRRGSFRSRASTCDCPAVLGESAVCGRISDVRSRHVSVIVVLLLLVAGCGGEVVSPMPAATPTMEASPAPQPTSTATPTPTATPAPASTSQATAYPLEYDDVFVQTIEEQDNEGRSLLDVAYPVIEQPLINESLETIAAAFVDEFHAVAAEQEEAYQEYLQETGEAAASFRTDYVQHFEVTLADANLISIAIEQYRGTGGTGSTDVTGYVFDRSSGAQLTPGDIFAGDEYLERLSTLSRVELERVIRAQMQALDFDSEAAREEWGEGMLGMMEEGTTPEPDNFDGLLFLAGGTVRISFDRYQVAPGSEGVVTVELPLEDVADLLTPRMRQLLGQEAAAPDATALP